MEITSIQSCSDDNKRTIICRGTYNNIPAYFKIFNIGPDVINRPEEQSLIYESHIYRRLNQPGSDRQHKQFFIPLIGCLDITIVDLVACGSSNIIMAKLGSCLFDLHRSNSKSPKHFRCIITKDTGSITLEKMLEQEPISELELVNVLLMIVMSIYILNMHFDIQHNDMHFNNILVKKELLPTEYTFTDTENITHTISSDIRIYIYDFDQSYMKGEENPILIESCIRGEGCNTMSYKDYFVFVQSLLMFFFTYYKKNNQTQRTTCSYIRNVLYAILDRDILDILDRRMLLDIFRTKKYFWSSYCLANRQVHNSIECLDTIEQDKQAAYLPDILPKLIRYKESLGQARQGWFESFFRW